MTEKIKSPLTGTVWKIEVKVGDQVSEDDTLVILESMKMEIPVDTPIDGIVTAILVTEGQSVGDGQILVELEAS